MFTAPLFTVAKKWQQVQCLWLDEWADKMGRIHTVENHSARTRSKVLIHGITRTSTDTGYNMDGPWKRYSERKKADTKVHTSYDSIPVKCRNRQIDTD